MPSFLVGLPAKLWAVLAAAGAALLVLWRVVAGIKQAERDRIAAVQAEQDNQTRRQADAAAADAERDGASELLKRGRF